MNQICMVLLDLQKTFDTANHTMGLKNILLVGLDPIFPKDLTYSTNHLITCGVPQGYILCPRFF